MSNNLELLFNTNYVHIEWCDELKEKECFCANDIYTLRKNVIDGDFHNYGKIDFNDEDEFLPFKLKDEYFVFCYYDENYNKKRNEILNFNK